MQQSNAIEHRISRFEQLRTPPAGRRIGYWVLGIVGLLGVVMFIPWQQNITGEGEVTAFNPKNRPQTVQNIIGGRIQRWHVVEGQKVDRGDTILSISEIKDEYFDPRLMQRLREQLQAQNDYIATTQDQIGFAGRQVNALAEARELSLSKARNKLIQARNKIAIDSATLEAEQVNYALAERQFKRYQELYEKNGLISLTDLEKRRQSLQEKKAKLASAQNYLLNTRNELLTARIEINSVEQDYAEKLGKVRADRAYKTAVLAEAGGKLAQLENKLSNVAIRQQQYVVLAPQSGFITRTLKTGLGENIKEGEPLATIVPLRTDRAVELYIKTMDFPLLKRGQPVRVQFDGWPALQFSGWPNASFGTFGGRVTVIDQMSSGVGQFRILVQPDTTEEGWPEQVRIGSGARGWAMLSSVPIWYELWRQFNGFPPTPVIEGVVKPAETDKGGKK